MLSGNILMQALRHIQLKLHINLAKLKDEIKNPDVDRISPLIKGIEARIRLLKNVRDTSTKDEVEDSQDTVLSMVAVFIFIALAIGAFSMGFAMALKNGSVGSATDADFWFLLQGNIMWTLGSIMMIVPLFRGSWFAPAYLSMWIFLTAGFLCNVASVAIYIQVNTGWSSMLAFFGSIASAAAVLVMTQGTTKPDRKRKLKAD
ncbi:hypothetical protein FGSG_09246 [Fusarium graminearum PH-1]|uniref:hypothetical protein n=1 Tax=Gibberella zeae (strain ATCC MYA-4620 / CBS 123657 / FGSC 9075 / NRRL 31084 / PH-1) TaxID=229533 RepID=UPI00021F142F|nr:hypothetical protein FGSG_09246 [Fusarium graminearum PH-1]ESU15792.1 hypothetical protein FGSG_09246 [Fusarium graminearum PH-1]|eukprot:XP_011328524.1 hypothetical protein FGSG_09246 [Fusarium graminearum PH-1]